jgi:integrase
MRRGELLAVSWRPLDLEAETLTVDRQLIPAEQGCEFGQPKSTRSRRTLALDPETVRVLRDHREAQLVERALAGNAYRDQDLVFCDELGQPSHPKKLSYQSGRHRQAAGIPTGSLHTLRHTAAT